MGNNLIKLVQRIKKSNEIDANKNERKSTQQNGENSNRISVAKPSLIFKLNVHCFDDLFEYLSLEDLHSLGQTCKSMQQMTGEFFVRNYSGIRFNCFSDGIYMIQPEAMIRYGAEDECIAIPGFNQFITWVAIENIILHRPKNGIRHKVYNCSLKEFKYIKLHAEELKSIRKLSLGNVSLNKKLVDYILKILPKIEVFELKHSTITKDLYDVLLKYLKNMRHIKFYHITFQTQHKWLLQQYEKLEHLELGVNTSNRIDELCTFFELNPNIRSFACDAETLLSNKEVLLNSNIKLDTFKVMGSTFPRECIWDLLCELYSHGFYKRLHINTEDNLVCDQVIQLSMAFLEKLSISKSIGSLEPFSQHLIEYAEIDGFESKHYCDEIIMAETNENFIRDLINIERLYLFREKLDVLLLIKKLKNLKILKLFKFKSAEILQLEMWNTEREKLVDARKLTIYVPDDVFLATKWKTKNGITHFNMIEMRRSGAYKWDEYCYDHRRQFLPPALKFQHRVRRIWID